MNSSDLVIFRTKDPENLPLPSWDLLHMQWILHRIGALSGAANVPMKPWDYDSEDEGSDMGFEDVFDSYQDEDFVKDHQDELFLWMTRQWP